MYIIMARNEEEALMQLPPFCLVMSVNTTELGCTIEYFPLFDMLSMVDVYA